MRMRAAGSGSHLWRARVDLFAQDDDTARVSKAATALRGLLRHEGDVGSSDAGADQGLGVTERPVVGLLFWVHADDVGAAALTAVETAQRAGVAQGVGPELYDVTIIPEEAVVCPDDPSYPAFPD